MSRIVRSPLPAITMLLAAAVPAFAACPPCEYTVDRLPGIRSSVPIPANHVTCLAPWPRFIAFARDAAAKASDEGTRNVLMENAQRFEAVDWKVPSPANARVQIQQATKGLKEARSGLARERATLGNPDYYQLQVQDNILLHASNEVLSQVQLEYAQCVLKNAGEW